MFEKDEIYEFSSINPNTKKRRYFSVAAKDLEGAEKKAEMCLMYGHTGLRLERRLWTDLNLSGQPVTNLSKMLGSKI